MRLSKTTVLPAAALALTVSAPAGQANIYLLDFNSSQDICVSSANPADVTPITCSNGKFISQSYGDVSGQLDVEWDADLTGTAIENFRFWGSGYADLTGVAYYNPNATITFRPLPGFEVSLFSLKLGGFGATQTSSTFDETVTVTDLSNNVLFDPEKAPTPGTGLAARVVDFGGITSSSGLILRFTVGGGNIAVDDIQYSVKKIETPPIGVIPLPAGLPLVLAGLGALGLYRLRRG